jgi:transposase InsO family protein
LGCWRVGFAGAVALPLLDLLGSRRQSASSTSSSRLRCSAPGRSECAANFRSLRTGSVRELVNDDLPECRLALMARNHPVLLGQAAVSKTERMARKVYRSREQARADVFDYIERFYNPRRRLSTMHGSSHRFRIQVPAAMLMV